nr:hemolysin III family protein [Paludibacteraceae bacterium]
AVGVAGTLVAVYPMMKMAFSHDWTYVLGTTLFLVGMLFMYTCSTLYHAVTPGTDAKRIIRVYDHISIYVMIAGSYSLLCISALGGWRGWSLFGFLWACVVAGIIGKVRALGKHPKLSLTLYLVMGWAALVVIVPLWKSLPHSAFYCVLAEGIFYSIGAYFFSKDEQYAYFHAIWHVFILLGSLSHTAAMLIVLA